MSTLKVAAINNPSASSGGLAISASGNVTGAGLDLITTQSFSAVSSVSVNNCFSGDYDNYTLIVKCIVSSASTLVHTRLRSSGSDDATSNYDQQYSIAQVGTHYAAQSLAQAQWSRLAAPSTTYNGGSEILLLGPFFAASTGAVSKGVSRDTSISVDSVAAQHRSSTSYDGFSLIASTGTLTGTVSVFGYKK